MEQIIEEINYYNESEVENYELKNILNNFTLVLIYCKCNNISEFAKILHDLLKKELLENSDTFISKIYSLSSLIEQRKNNVKEIKEDQAIFLNVIKSLMTENISYLRPDVKIFLEKIYR